MGIPQHWTKLANEKHDAKHVEKHDDPATEATHQEEYGENPASSATPANPEEDDPVDEHAVKPSPPPDDAEQGETNEARYPHVIMVLPFALLLICVAFLPLIPAAEQWWHKNSNKFMVAFSLGIITLIYYGFFSQFTLEGHWPAHFETAADAGAVAKMTTIFGNAIIAEYLPFIVLLFSLYVIAGGIRIEGDFKATPFVNSMIFAIGAVLANFVGTTGAAMLLIRLLIDTNRNRKYKVHTIVFFIFTVCNNGGCLTPLGDPPLFLGYLKGVEFFWTLYISPYWLFANGSLILLYFLWDTFWFQPREAKAAQEVKKTGTNESSAQESGIKDDTGKKVTFRVTGLKVNLPLLLGVVLCVAFMSPTKQMPFGEFLFPGTDGYPWFFLREAIQLGLAALSLALSSRWIRSANAFSFFAILEVASLFFGIFICMQVPLQILSQEGGKVIRAIEKASPVPLTEEQALFWTTGVLSCWLDNAPTYVVFFEVGKSLQPKPDSAVFNVTIREALERQREELEAKRKDLEDRGKSLEANTKALETNREMFERFVEVKKMGDEPVWFKEPQLFVSYERKNYVTSEKLVPVTGGYICHFHLIAIALGTVFMGGMTYIANGPNFMVKAIAEQSKIKMPSFFGYMVYSCLILLPLYAFMTAFLMWM